MNETIKTASGISRTLLREGMEQCREKRAGISGLPVIQEVLFLLEYAAREPDQTALALAEDALPRMDPHWEKTLTGSALPGYAYLQAYAQTGRPQYKEAACRMLEYALRRLRRPAGGFAGGPDGDGTVITGWNAMMVAALAKACRVLGEKRYLRAAESTRMFLKIRLSAADGALYHCWRDQKAAMDGTLDDYAYYCWALVELYEANYSVSCLREAVKLAHKLEELFWDRQRGGFYLTAGDSGRKEARDEAFPSGNSLAALALGRLWQLTGDAWCRELWQQQLAWLAGAVREAPGESCGALLAMTEALYPERELLCVSAEAAPAWLAGTAEEYRLAAVVKTRDNSRALELLAPYTAAYPVPGQGLQLYLRRDGTYTQPVETLEQLRRQIAEEAVPV